MDSDTGRVTVERHVMVADPGRVLNPLIVEGQLHGGIAQALLERVVFDPDSGQLLSGSFMDFALPRADDLRGFTTVCNPVPGADNPLGVKGRGSARGRPPARRPPWSTPCSTRWAGSASAPSTCRSRPNGCGQPWRRADEASR